MGEQTLMTMVQVSDLHIGTIDPRGTGHAVVHPDVAKLLVSLPHLDGLLGHGADSLRDLAAFMRRLPRQRGVPRRLLVTGDFSRCGEAAELALAGQFLRGRINLGSAAAPLPVGVQAGTDPIAIPGNHDHWGGVNWPVTGAATHYGGASFARPMPRVDTIGLPNGMHLVLLQVDSDADVYPMGAARFLARGDFSSQLHQLAQMLPPPHEDELRVMAIHHSHAKRGYMLRMQHASRVALQAFVAKHRVRLLLTGHTHVCDEFEVRDASGRLVARELCCGSTTQIDHVPPAWRSLLSTRAKLRRIPNSLLLHTLEIDRRGQLLWRARPHYRDSVLGFRDNRPPFIVPL